MLRLSLLAATALMVAGPALAASTAEASLRAADAKLIADMGSHDGAALATDLADDLTFSHASGLRQSKAEFIARETDPKTPVEHLKTYNETIAIIGNVGIVQGDFAFALNGKTLGASRLAVYVRHRNAWQLRAWQTTKEDTFAGFPDLVH